MIPKKTYAIEYVPQSVADAYLKGLCSALSAGLGPEKVWHRFPEVIVGKRKPDARREARFKLLERLGYCPIYSRIVEVAA